MHKVSGMKTEQKTEGGGKTTIKSSFSLITQKLFLKFIKDGFYGKWKDKQQLVCFNINSEKLQ